VLYQLSYMGKLRKVFWVDVSVLVAALKKAKQP
jgi:hypothetical protein